MKGVNGNRVKPFMDLALKVQFVNLEDVELIAKALVYVYRPSLYQCVTGRVVRQVVVVDERSWLKTRPMRLSSLAINGLRIAKRHETSPLSCLKRLIVLLVYRNVAVRQDGLHPFLRDANILAFEDEPMGLLSESRKDFNACLLRPCDNGLRYVAVNIGTWLSTSTKQPDKEFNIMTEAVEAHLPQQGNLSGLTWRTA
jgi:hypothetical protein